MKRSCCLVGAIAVLLAIGAPAGAQSFDREKFRAFLDTPASKALVARAVASVPAEILPRCPTLKTEGGETAVLESIVFGPNGAPKSGEWLDRLPASGCGADTTINILFTAAPPDGKIKSTVLVPGSTIASPPLQRGALSYALSGFTARVKGCGSALVVDSRFGGYGDKDAPIANPGPDAANSSPWWETWTVKGCGKTVDVPLNFAPDPQGVRITVRINEITNR